VFDLQCPDGPPEPRENYGFSRQNLNRIKIQFAAALAVACNRWSQQQGEP